MSDTTDGLDALFEQKLANLTAEEYDALVLRVRPPQEQESADPKQRAAAALRKATGATLVRSLKPGQAATMDYRAERVNVVQDAAGSADGWIHVLPVEASYRLGRATKQG